MYFSCDVELYLRRSPPHTSAAVSIDRCGAGRRNAAVAYSSALIGIRRLSAGWRRQNLWNISAPAHAAWWETAAGNCYGEGESPGREAVTDDRLRHAQAEMARQKSALRAPAAGRGDVVRGGGQVLYATTIRSLLVPDERVAKNRSTRVTADGRVRRRAASGLVRLCLMEGRCRGRETWRGCASDRRASSAGSGSAPLVAVFFARAPRGEEVSLRKTRLEIKNSRWS